MSYHVKPEDVPEELQNRADTEFSTWYDGPVIDIAAILNAAIEAGLVSPPVKCMRWQGVLEMENGVPMVRIDAPDLWPQKLISYEHWKGQTE